MKILISMTFNPKNPIKQKRFKAIFIGNIGANKLKIILNKLNFFQYTTNIGTLE